MIQRNLYDEINKAIYGVISYGKCGMSFLIIKLHEEKLYRVSPNVASNFFEPLRKQLVILCITGFTQASHYRNFS